jgi:hypothetical protein
MEMELTELQYECGIIYQFWYSTHMSIVFRSISKDFELEFLLPCNAPY